MEQRIVGSVVIALILMVKFSCLSIAGTNDYFPDRSGIQSLYDPSGKKIFSTELSPMSKNYLNKFEFKYHGLGNSVEFNRYVDDTAMGYRRGWLPHPDEIECDPESDNHGCHDELFEFLMKKPNYQELLSYCDERDFLTVKKINQDNKYYHDRKNLKIGDQVRIFAWLHNNGSEGRDTNDSFDTEVSINWENPEKVVATISSRNANPNSVSDIVSFSFKEKYTFKPINEIKVFDYKSKELDFSLIKRSANSQTINVGTVKARYSDIRRVYFDFEVIQR